MPQKENVTYSKLINWHRELSGARQNDSIFARFLKPKINEFYNNNKVRIDSFNEWFQKLEDEYLDVEVIQLEGGKTKTQPAFEGEGKDKKRKMKEGKSREEFDRLLSEKWNEVISVEI
jgi:hypothetical protein